MRKLTYRERVVVNHRYGIRGEGPCSLKETGRAVNCSVERVRQIEAKAMRHMREQERRDEKARAGGLNRIETEETET